MNKTIPFGYHYVGSHTIIKLNMNLTAIDADEIRNMPDFSVTRVGRYDSMLCRIEAVVPWNCSHENYLRWYEKLEIYKINAKMEKLANRKATLLDVAIGAENLLADLDLPF